MSGTETDREALVQQIAKALAKGATNYTGPDDWIKEAREVSAIVDGMITELVLRVEVVEREWSGMLVAKEDAEAKVATVGALHPKVLLNWPNDYRCPTCCDGDGESLAWPCPTSTALESSP